MDIPSIQNQQYLFKTSRLVISDVRLMYQEKHDEKVNLLHNALKILSPNVTKSLPEHFQKIYTLEEADNLFQQIMSESRCFAVRLSDKKTIIGFILIYGLDAGTAHIGYFLGENYWKQGYATEFLNALVAWYKENTKIAKLIAGIGTDNKSSAQLLKGTGFIKCMNENEDTLYYEYLFMRND